LATIKILTREDLCPEAIKHIKQTDVVLDIGCGIYPQKYIKPKLHICCEPHAEYIEYVQKHNPHSDRVYVMINSTWDIIKSFPSKSVDTIIFTDVIEHLNKKDGYELIKHAERVARVQVILFTPLGYLPQCHPNGQDAWGLSGGKWQEHKSGWYLKDFNEKWNIYACEKFFFTNNVGKKLEKPHGAFWAILNIETEVSKNHAVTVLLPN
jgi:predicted SAM-dependent methyltransferase